MADEGGSGNQSGGARRTDLLTTCPACGHEVSRAARTCPNCGHGLRRRRPAARLAAVGVLAVVVVSAIGAISLGVRLPHLQLSQAPRPSPLTTAQVIALEQHSVVSIKVSTYRGGTVEASGFVYGANGHILTNAHVIARAIVITVMDADGRYHSADLIGVDRSSDVAELDIAGMEFGVSPKPLKATSRPVEVGSNVLLIGEPSGVPPSTVTNASIGSVGRDLTLGSANLHNLIQTDVVANPASSGGPVINASGDLIGMVTLDSTGNAFVIPVTSFSSSANSWAQTETVIALEPPLVRAAASTLVLGGVVSGFQGERSDPWGSIGYHVLFRRQHTGSTSQAAIDIYVEVNTTAAGASINYQSYSDGSAKQGYAPLGPVGELGDEATTWGAKGLSQWAVNYKVLWRDRNVVVVLYWSSEQTNDVSIADVLKVAAQQENLVSADLASTQWPGA